MTVGRVVGESYGTARHFERERQAGEEEGGVSNDSCLCIDRKG